MKDMIDGVLIDAGESGFHLILSGEHAEWRFLLPGPVAEELLRAVKREIEPWVLEGELVRSRYGKPEEVEDDAYGPRDPKAKEHHERMAER